MSERDFSAGDKLRASGAAEAESSWLFLALAGVTALLTGFIYAVLIVCYILIVRDPGYGFWPSAEVMIQEQPLSSGNPPDDPDGALHITFMRDGQAHYFRKNNLGGNILIITGMAYNNYEEPRSFIRLRGHLLSADGQYLVDRYVYACNVLSEEELTDLPMTEINRRLSIKEGRGNQNVHVQPGTQFPFMVVFDTLPDGMAEYRIDAIGSDPAQ